MSQSEEGWRARACELTFAATSPSNDSAATLANEGSRSWTLSGSSAQLSSSRQLATPRLLERFRLLLPDLENLRHACARPQIFQVRRAASDARERSVYRKTVLTRIEEKRQHLATYGWTYPG